MKLIQNTFFRLSLVTALLITGFFSCKNPAEGPAPTVTGFSPTSGPVGSSVTITGLNYSTTPSSNLVKFNGVTAVVTDATKTTLTATVPTEALTGKITVAVNGIAASSPGIFTVTQSINSFSPSVGIAGTTVVTITGNNFDLTPANNIVKFNGIDATVTSATSTELTVTVPVGATTGTISVTIAGVTATSTGTFSIPPPPTITSFSPNIGSAGTSVVITGTNFSSSVQLNTVKFNGKVATVTSATSTQITATVPGGATTGKISVTVGPYTVTSIDDFTICSGIQLLLSNVVITSIAGTRDSFNYTFDLTNVGSTVAALTLSNSTVQAYVSTDAVVGNDLAAGGWGLDATIGSGLTYNGSLSASISGGTVDTYPYLILNFSTTLSECNTAVGHQVIMRIIP